MAQNQSAAAQNTANKTALFRSFTYKGEKQKLAGLATENAGLATEEGFYRNPVLPGCYPDPSICRKGGDYYMVNSTFCYYPGVPIWHSRDLVSWERLGYVLNRPSLLKINRKDKMPWGVYAPDIQYNPMNDTFYMITTGTGYGSTTYVKTKDPKSGVWSEPVSLPSIHGIDPSIFFDKRTGKAYIVNNDIPATEPAYEGHRAIWIREFDWQNDCVKGEAKVIVDGGVKPQEKPIWIEGPHLYGINGNYFLMCAEGGTAEAHSEVLFQADEPMGQYTPCKTNPILTQRDLPENRADKVTCSGHADLIETQGGEWFAVFLGVRPFKGGHDLFGRETFMLPVKWEQDQPVILPEKTPIPILVPLSKEQQYLQAKSQVKGFRHYGEQRLWSDGKLADNAEFIRRQTGGFYSINQDGSLGLSLGEDKMGGFGFPAMIGLWVNSLLFEANTCLAFSPENGDKKAGIALFHDDEHYVRCFKTCAQNGNVGGKKSMKQVLRVEAWLKGSLEAQWEMPISKREATEDVLLKVRGLGDGTFAFHYAFQGKDKGKAPIFRPIGKPISGEILSTRTAGGFTGTLLGVFAE